MNRINPSRTAPMVLAKLKSQVLLVSFMGILGVPGCDQAEDLSKDLTLSPAKGGQVQAGPSSIADLGTILVDREDLVAVAAPGVEIRPEVMDDLQAHFPPKPMSGKRDRGEQGRDQVMYVGPIETATMEGERAPYGFVRHHQEWALAKVDRFFEDKEVVMWANLESRNLYAVIYAEELSNAELAAKGSISKQDWGDDAPVKQVEFPEGQPDHNLHARARHNDPRFDRFGPGIVVDEDTRRRTHSENEPVEGRRYKRMLSIGEGSGALIGRRHFLTSAHLIMEQDQLGQEIRIFDLPIRAGRNGKAYIGFTSSPIQLYWMADWSRREASEKRMGYDMAWGVLDNPLGSDAGYFGYWATSSDTIVTDGLGINSVSYPSCEGEAPPPECLVGHQFEDARECFLGSEKVPDALGWGRAVEHTCDASDGAGGSPLIVTDEGKQYVWAVHSGNLADKNYAARLTLNRAANLLPKMFERYPRDE